MKQIQVEAGQLRAIHIVHIFSRCPFVLHLENVVVYSSVWNGVRWDDGVLDGIEETLDVYSTGE